MEFSAAVILATNYATDESQVTLLFAPGKDSDRGKNGEIKPEGDRDCVRFGFTYAVAVKSKVFLFMSPWVGFFPSKSEFNIV